MAMGGRTARMAAILTAHQVPGATVAIRTPDGAVRHENFGVRDMGAGVPMSSDTLLGIASVTKSFTALALCQLAEAGQLRLEDPVVRYLPDFRRLRLPSADAVALHHLLSHSSGLPDYSRALNLRTKWAHYTAAQQARWRAAEPDIGPAINTVDDLLAAMAAEPAPPVGLPGERFHYSNEGFALLGTVIELASGQSYPDYLQRHVFDPLGMSRTTLNIPGPEHEPVTRLYEPSATGAPVEVPAWPQAPATLADGFIRSTTDDLLRYLESFIEPGDERAVSVLSPAGRRRLATPEVSVEMGCSYGLGWFLDEWRGSRRMFHTGSMSGVGSFVAVLPEVGTAVVVLSNLTTEGPARAVGEVLMEVE